MNVSLTAKSLVAALATLCLAATCAGTSAAEPVDFNRDVRPILAEACFPCHGPDAKHREADLRLDTRDGAVADLGGYQAVVPGDSGASAFIERIVAADEDERMPPADSGKQLSAAQIALLKAWIDQGAPYAQHWAYAPLVRPPVPQLAQTPWPWNEIDRFILSRLQSQRLGPAEGADPRTMVRRLFIDLTGLPPASADVSEFARDPSPAAYGDLVARLLDSPHYGERMAMYWLDLVRYADSVGYHGDQPMPVSPFRDYVIRAFNENMPFDQFAGEQLAGDLLPEPTVWQQVASGYNRLNQKTAEGGAQDKEYLAIYQADRIRNVSSVWLGTTMGCCQCHDHKYDPFTMKDFYSLGAFFADVTQKGSYASSAKNWGPQVRVPTAGQQAEMDQTQRRIADLERQLDQPTPALTAAQQKWEQDVRSGAGKPAAEEVVWVDDKTIPDGKQEGTWQFVGPDTAPVFSGQFSRRQTGTGTVQHFVLGSKNIPMLKTGDVLFAYVYLDPQRPPRQLMLQVNDGSWEHRAYWGDSAISWGQEGTASRQAMGALPAKGQWIRLEVPVDRIGLKDGSAVSGIAFTQFDGLAYWDKTGVRRAAGLPSEIVAIIQTPSGQRSPQQGEQLAAYYRSVAPSLAPLRQQLTQLRADRKRIEGGGEFCLISVPTKPRTVRILPRGNWLDESGPEVQAAIPEVFGMTWQKDRRATRRDLADWITSRDNPLTARVFVNRLWKLFFGRGLVRSLDDFGTQGTYPSHAELLDWLAVEFTDSGWDVKHLVRLIVTSATYRQSSFCDQGWRERDLYNDLFARQGRFRHDAETVRDNALAVSGLLVRTIGGPSVKPYQPAGYWKHLNFPKRKYEVSKGQDLYRRGLYTHWQRTFLHPSMKAFDAPTREECTVDRTRSNTPLQALVLLNDPVYVEAARALGERMLAHDRDGQQNQIALVYGEVLQREPTSAESTAMGQFYERQSEFFAAHTGDAEQLIRVGQKPIPDGLDPAQLAAATMVARVVLNLHETITRY